MGLMGTRIPANRRTGREIGSPSKSNQERTGQYILENYFSRVRGLSPAKPFPVGPPAKPFPVNPPADAKMLPWAAGRPPPAHRRISPDRPSLG